MSYLCLLIGVMHLSGATGNTALDQDHKVWSVCRSNGSCSCGSDLNEVVMCEEDVLHIVPCYCMYYDAKENKTLLGNCPLTCYYRTPVRNLYRNWYPLERYAVENASLFNEAACGQLPTRIISNREGRFCGRCKEGYGLAVYSYHYTSCIPCTDYGLKNWLLYFTVALLPLTVFYFLVVIFKFNLASSRLNGIIFVLQCILSSVQMRVLEGFFFAESNKHILIGFKIIMSIVGFVNLDFFRTVYPYFCLHPKLNILHVVSLDYIVALYPFLLIFLTYVLVNMHDSNYRVIVWAWKPFKQCLSRYQRQTNVQSSLIEVFATFLLLSNVKILGLCFDLTGASRVYDATGLEQTKSYLIYDASIEYFSSEHIPFLVLAAITGFVFVILPFFLFLFYPCGCFHKILNCFKLRCQTLHIFMDAFQGSYKTSPRDMRSFSAFYFFLRFLLLSCEAKVKSRLYFIVVAILMLWGCFVMATFQPYKNRLHNIMDMVTLLILALIYTTLSADMIAQFIDHTWFNLEQVLLCVVILGLVMYNLCILAWMSNIPSAIIQFLLGHVFVRARMS